MEETNEAVTNELKKADEANKKKNNYIFPNVLANVMSKVDLRTQYEASMLSMSFMMIGLITTVAYMFIYIDMLQLWYKIFLVVNALAGITFMSSYVITIFQQYQNYMAVVEFQKEQKKEQELLEQEVEGDEE